jgi:hypothetical protein
MPIGPLPKFLIIKASVFVSWWQVSLSHTHTLSLSLALARSLSLSLSLSPLSLSVVSVCCKGMLLAYLPYDMIWLQGIIIMYMAHNHMIAPILDYSSEDVAKGLQVSPSLPPFPSLSLALTLSLSLSLPLSLYAHTHTHLISPSLVRSLSLSLSISLTLCRSRPRDDGRQSFVVICFIT